MATSTRPVSSSINTHATVVAFGLSAEPFPADPGRGVFVATSIHGPARKTLQQWTFTMIEAPNHNDRLGVVTGEDGMGKTRLLTEIERDLSGNARVNVVTLPDVPSHRTDAQLLKAILAALGADPVGRTGLELRGEVREVLREMQRSGRQPGLLIDDADFKGSQLELIRNLLRDAEGTGLWIVLFGTPDLHDRMRRRRSLRGLLGPEISLSDLARHDLQELVSERLRSVRTDDTPESIFDEDAIDALIEWAEGNPGQLLRSARACLQIAAEQGSRGVTVEAARSVIRALTINAANEARAEVVAATGQPVQTRMPLLEQAGSGSSPATTQQALWDEEGSA